jgi:hypothetical protein
MNEEELRVLIRTAIQRHLGTVNPESDFARAPLGELPRDGRSLSFDQYRLERPADDVMCLIEPAVRCNHCGFCKCHGH